MAVAAAVVAVAVARVVAAVVAVLVVLLLGLNVVGISSSSSNGCSGSGVINRAFIFEWWRLSVTVSFSEERDVARRDGERLLASHQVKHEQDVAAVLHIAEVSVGVPWISEEKPFLGPLSVQKLRRHPDSRRRLCGISIQGPGGWL